MPMEMQKQLNKRVTQHPRGRVGGGGGGEGDGERKGTQ